ncbi:MAG: hypothetical protein U1E36_02245 [Rickettsiales bacterium]
MTNLQEYLNQRLSADILNQYKNKSTQELVSDIVENPKAKTAREAMEAIDSTMGFFIRRFRRRVKFSQQKSASVSHCQFMIIRKFWKIKLPNTARSMILVI